MSVYLKDGRAVVDSGKVATSADCCCINGACCIDGECSLKTEAACIEAGGTYQGDDTDCNPNPCPSGSECNCDDLLSPFYNPDDGLYYKTRIDDCCALSTTYSDPCSPTLKFATLTSVNEACNEGYTGSCTSVNHLTLVGETCDLVRISCEGDITTDPGGLCIEGCSEGCDMDCNFGGCQPNTKNTQTLSDERVCYCCENTFAAFDGSGRQFYTKTENFTRTAHQDEIPPTIDGCDLSENITTTTTIDPTDCSEEVTCSGTYSYENITHPELEFSECAWESDGAGGCHFVLTSGAGGIGCGAHCTEECLSCTLDVISATVMSCDCNSSSEFQDSSATYTITLSNECMLDTLSPPP